MKPWIPERGWASGPDRLVSGLLPSSASLSPLPVPGHLAPVPLPAFVVAPLPARVVMVTAVRQVLDSCRRLPAHCLCPPTPRRRGRPRTCFHSGSMGEGHASLPGKTHGALTWLPFPVQLKFFQTVADPPAFSPGVREILHSACLLRTRGSTRRQTSIALGP